MARPLLCGSFSASCYGTRARGCTQRPLQLQRCANALDQTWGLRLQDTCEAFSHLSIHNMLISWSASGNGPVKDEEGASDMEEVTSINDKEASVLAEDSASNVGDDVAVPREEHTNEANNALKNKGAASGGRGARAGPGAHAHPGIMHCNRMFHEPSSLY